jgi:hypothetical protein
MKEVGVDDFVQNISSVQKKLTIISLIQQLNHAFNSTILT